MRVLLTVWLALWAVFSIPWGSLTTAAQWERVNPPRVESWGPRAVHVLNFLFYVPLVPIGAGVGFAAAPLIGAGVALSAAAEAIQLFSTDRFPDPRDVGLNTAGTLIGAAIVAGVRTRRRPPAR